MQCYSRFGVDLVVGFVGFVFLVCFGFGFWVFVLLWLLFVGFFSFGF